MSPDSRSGSKVFLRPSSLGPRLGVRTYRSHIRGEEKEKGLEFPELREKENEKEASELHHETFLRYRDELSQLEAEVKELAEKRGMYKLLSEQREGEVRSHQAELDADQKEHADLLEQVKIFEVSDDEPYKVSNGQNLHVQQKDTLAKDLEAAKSAAKLTKADAEKLVAQYKDDAEAAQECLKAIVKYVRWQSRREAFEEVHARGFDLSAEIENVKRLEAEAKMLAYPEEEEAEGSGESEDGEDPDGSGDEAGFGEDQAS
ncbi:uncharacterized protein [Nicotiana tomentosiformis]|uniref:uncharacterized protein n=1 Tax=Nicotiana tomentosiformis TaxID=4098 RepID=UPI00388C9EE6